MTRLDGRKGINHKMHQLGATGQKQADCRFYFDATYPMQNVGMIWIGRYEWKSEDVY